MKTCDSSDSGITIARWDGGERRRARGNSRYKEERACEAMKGGGRRKIEVEVPI